MLTNTREYCSVTTAKTDFFVMLFYVGPSSFLSLAASSNRPKFLAFQKKKKNKVTTWLNHFSLEIILLI